jgi:hypothetical protein
MRADGLVPCPRGSLCTLAECHACSALQGTLEDVDLVVLCGDGSPTPALRFASVAMDDAGLASAGVRASER